MFTNRFSFGGEFLKKQLQRANLVLKDNTPDEIVEGLEELLSRMNDDGFIKLSRVDEIILEIRSAARVASFGHISNSFLWRNYKIG
jgi:hypothetical protein